MPFRGVTVSVPPKTVAPCKGESDWIGRGSYGISVGILYYHLDGRRDCRPGHRIGRLLQEYQLCR